MRPLSDFVPDLPRIPFIHTGQQPLPSEMHGSIMLLGNFDGLHRGHGELVAAGLRLARGRRVPLAMLQCDPHPRAYFSGTMRFRVSTGAAQARLLAVAGVDLIFAPRFDKAFASMTPEKFVDDILVEQLRIGGIVVGRDFRFGRQRLGNADLLSARGARLGFSLQVVDDQLDGGQRVSTSSVRAAIEVGDLGLATRLLGHAWLTQVHLDQGAGWQFGPEQLLPPAGAWPIAALDRAGQHLAYSMVEIGEGASVMMMLPSGTALVKWLPTTIDTSAVQTGRGAHG